MEKVLQQILSELKELRQGQEAHSQELKTLNDRMGRFEEGQEAQGRELRAQGRKIEKLHTDLIRLSMHVEGEITDKIRGLYDHREVVDNSLQRIERKLNEHEDRLDLHWQEIMVLKTKCR